MIINFSVFSVHSQIYVFSHDGKPFGARATLSSDRIELGKFDFSHRKLKLHMCMLGDAAESFLNCLSALDQLSLQRALNEFNNNIEASLVCHCVVVGLQLS